ncbi:MAG: DUF1223 domain-containing protein [Sphingomonas sp.]|uniref:DUF1223 domain-containing protein n=1 Tax=Sphingomonas sp. TaxID=28214 RepID=UPI0018148793|nr:DUF1223 domain-containing protein [Sphingomonas sp.]MBA3666709.1 DUF1223 domain-containing protein [Sphingomonas sp.]
MSARLLLSGAIFAFAACSSSSDSAMAPARPEKRVVDVAKGDARHLVVVEIYQSQGCSSCPPAIENVNSIAARDDILALDFAVTYWDYLGWADTFAKPAYTARQWDYAHASGRGRVYTPQVVVNGREALVGNVKPELDSVIARQGYLVGGPAIDVAGRQLVVGAGKAAAGTSVWAVDYDPRDQQVAIKAGENGGRTLPHRNIVRRLTRLGAWTGARASFALALPENPAYRTAILIQQGVGGPIIAARKL